ncbi:unnamed protein product [Orchesella dallaii]|uniref:Secreted protein n=1 Tax=Orchesella dallaii TaxID=48710 RepID=A0ABP1PM64_9HEXA
MSSSQWHGLPPFVLLIAVSMKFNTHDNFYPDNKQLMDSQVNSNDNRDANDADCQIPRAKFISVHRTVIDFWSFALCKLSQKSTI